jgi:hypothetical protein
MSKGRILAIVLISVGCVAVGVAPSVLQFFAQREISRLQRAGFRIQAEGIEGFIFGVGAKRIDSWIALPIGAAGISAVPLQIQVDDVSTSAYFQPLFLQTSVRIKGSLYGGALNATLLNLLGAPLLSGTANRVDLSIHPQLRALGIDSGVVNLTTTNHPIKGVWRAEAEYTLSITEFDLRPPRPIQTISGISQLRKGQVDLKAKIKPEGALSIESASFDSSLASGSLTGSATIQPSGHLLNVNANLRVNLDRPDSSKLKVWLPLLTNQEISSEANNFTCQIRSVACGSGAALRLGSSCLRASCVN